MENLPKMQMRNSPCGIKKHSTKDILVLQERQITHEHKKILQKYSSVNIRP